MEHDKAATVLHSRVAQVCPIEGVSMGSFSDKQTWSITYSQGATPEQQAAAQAVLSVETYDNLQKGLSQPSESQQENINDFDFRPQNILFYYGYPNSFNSLINGWVNEKVAQDMANYDIVVLGDGVEYSQLKS
mgnify:CR=1 FL=1